MKINCQDNKLNTANIKPAIENLNIQEVWLRESKNLTFEKGKTFPGNEETIKVIYFKNIKVIKFENGVFDTFINLETLWFYGTPITNINENLLTQKFGKVLLNLDFSDCNLTEINTVIFENLINLEELDLSRNEQINGKINGKFPDGLKKLKYLDLKFCNLSSLNHDTFGHLRNLEGLYLSSNRFTSIPSTIIFLPNLRALFFNDNLIENIKKNEFSLNKKLDAFYFEDNSKLKYVESCAFCNLKDLKEIRFDRCHNLSYIDENAFGGISNGFTPKLKIFDISECNISVLHENLLDWKNIKIFDVIGNPFACNCSMAWLFKDLMSNDSIYEKKVSYFYSDSHHKFRLGCLGPPPRTPNHTYPYTIVEIFSSCENSSSLPNILWYLLSFLSFIALFILLVHDCVNRRIFVFLFCPGRSSRSDCERNQSLRARRHAKKQPQNAETQGRSFCYYSKEGKLIRAE